nr:LamG domain-containing protein [uncultured Rhodopila sp.]
MTLNINARRRFPTIINPSQIPTWPFELDAANPLVSGACALWPLNDPSFRDYSPYGIAGAPVNSPPIVSGASGPMASFNGTTQSITANASAPLLTWSNTSVFIRFQVKGAMNQYTRLIEKGANSEWNITTNLTANSYDITATLAGGSPAAVTTTTSYNDGKIHDVLMTVASGGVMTMYVDGALVGTATGSFPSSTSGNIVISNYGGGGSYNFNGLLGQVIIWNRVLTASDAVALHVDPFAMFLPTIRRARRTVVGGTNYTVYFAAAQASSAATRWNSARLLMLGEGQAAGLIRSLTRGLASSGPSVSSLIRNPIRLIGAPQGASSNILRGPARVLLSGITETMSSQRTPARLFATASTEAASIGRGMIRNLADAQPQSATTSRHAARSFALGLIQAANIARAASRLASVPVTLTCSIIQGKAKLLAAVVTQASPAVVVRVVVRSLSVAGASAATLRRAVVRALALDQPSPSTAQRAVFRLFRLAQAEASNAVVGRNRAVVASTAQPETVGLDRSAARFFSFGQPSQAAVLRGLARMFGWAQAYLAKIKVPSSAPAPAVVPTPVRPRQRVVAVSPTQRIVKSR